jgi:hypothetical protein
VALILNLTLPHDIEDDTEKITETDAQDSSIAAFAGRDADIENMGKDMTEVDELKAGEIEA